MTQEKALITAIDKLHDVRSLLLLCESKANELAERSKADALETGSIARGIEISVRLLLEAVEMVDDASIVARRGAA